MISKIKKWAQPFEKIDIKIHNTIDAYSHRFYQSL